MKKICICVLLVLFVFCQSAQAGSISQHFTGSWFNPNQNGHGISLEVLDDNRVVFYWYIYNPDGTPTFLIAIGEYEGGTITATAYHHTGMTWGVFDEDDVVQTVWGELQLVFSDCNNVTLNYSSTHGRTDIPYGDGSIPMVRLANVLRNQCQYNRAAGIYRGYLETDQADSAQGATLLMSQEGDFVAWVDDHYAVFGRYGVNEAESGEFRLDQQAPNVLYRFDQPGGQPQNLSTNGSMSPEYAITIEEWRAGSDQARTGEFYAIDALYRDGLDFSMWAGLSLAEEFVSGETGYIDVWPSDGKLNLSGTMGNEGCSISGSLTPSDPLFDMLHAELTLTSCAEMNGTYTGLGIQMEAYQFGDGLRLVMFVHNGSYPFALNIVRY